MARRPTPILSTILVAAGLLLGARVAWTQQSTTQRSLFNSDQVPRELVIAILETQYGGGGSPDIVIGDAPGALKSRLPIPPGSRVLGSLLSISNSSVFLDVPARADTLTAAIWRELQPLGWTRAEQTYMGMGGGFRPAQSSVAAPSMWCGTNDALSFMMVPRGDGHTLLRYLVQDRESSICDRRLSGNDAFSRAPRHPTLISPPGSDFYAAACRPTATMSGSSSSGTGARIRTTSSPQEMMDSFSRQLADSGWTPTAVDGSALSKSFTKKEADGTVRRTTVAITVPQGVRSDCRELSMNTEVFR